MHEGAILIVDDSADDAELLRLAVKKLGVVRPVILLQSGAQAIDYFLGRNGFDDREKHPGAGILFLDLKMPPPDGFDVLAFLNSQPQLKRPLTAVLSGQEHMSQIQRAYDLGAHTYLVKPVRTDDLENLISFFSRYWQQTPKRFAQ